MRTTENEDEIEQVQLDIFVQYFLNKEEWTQHICDQNSTFNTLLNLENHFIVVEEPVLPQYRSTGIIDTMSSRLQQPILKLDLVNFKIYALLMCAGRPEEKAQLLFDLVVGK